MIPTHLMVLLEPARELVNAGYGPAFEMIPLDPDVREMAEICISEGGWPEAWSSGPGWNDLAWFGPARVGGLHDPLWYFGLPDVPGVYPVSYWCEGSGEDFTDGFMPCGWDVLDPRRRDGYFGMYAFMCMIWDLFPRRFPVSAPAPTEDDAALAMLKPWHHGTRNVVGPYMWTPGRSRVGAKRVDAKELMEARKLRGNNASNDR